MRFYHSQNEMPINTMAVAMILEKIKACVIDGYYVLSMGDKRIENRLFMDEYNIRTDKVKRIILNLSTKDFCGAVRNVHPGYEHEILYIFVPRVILTNSLDEDEEVAIYIKINLLEQDNKAIIISFHKANKTPVYVFDDKEDSDAEHDVL